MEPVRATRIRSAALAVIALGAFACDGPASTVPLYLDLVTYAADRPSAGSRSPTRVSCAELNQFSLVLPSGSEFSADVTLLAEPSLIVSGCSPGARPGVEEQRGELQIAVSGASAGEISRTVALDPSQGWWLAELDLSRFSGSSVRVRVSGGDSGAAVFLRDLYVRHGVPVSERVAEPSQVLLISVDTLREDVVSAIGGRRETPEIDTLISEAELWTPHYAASGWTKPSHATLLTGQHGWLHGAVTGESSIAGKVQTLAERFRAHGFLTAALVYDCVWLDPKWGFSRGFSDYRNVRWTLPQMVRWTANWMNRHRDEPFFFFFHTFDVHSDFNRLPYESPGMTAETVQERFGVTDYGCRGGHCASNLLEAINAGEIEPLAEEAQILRYLYESGVAHLDEQLGALFDHLKRLGIYDDLLIVFTADHGEEFLEHGKLLHGTPWEEVVRVPLAIKWPRGRNAGARRQVASGAADLAPTVLHELGLPADGLPGFRLSARGPEDPVFLYNGEWSAVIRDGSKLVVDLEVMRRLLYDLDHDPGEARDLAEIAPDRVESLHRVLEERIAEDAETLESLNSGSPSGESPRLTPEERERLRALGYLD